MNGYMIEVKFNTQTDTPESEIIQGSAYDFQMKEVFLDNSDLQSRFSPDVLEVIDVDYPDEPMSLWQVGIPIQGYCDVWDKYCVAISFTRDRIFSISVQGYDISSMIRAICNYETCSNHRTVDYGSKLTTFKRVE